jgi:hypothetical protein
MVTHGDPAQSISIFQAVLTIFLTLSDFCNEYDLPLVTNFTRDYFDILRRQRNFHELSWAHHTSSHISNHRLHFPTLLLLPLLLRFVFFQWHSNTFHDFPILPLILLRSFQMKHNEAYDPKQSFLNFFKLWFVHIFLDLFVSFTRCGRSLYPNPLTFTSVTLFLFSYRDIFIG